MSRQQALRKIQSLDAEFSRRSAMLSLSTAAVPVQTRRRGAVVLAAAGVVVGALMSRVPIYGIIVKLFSVPAIATQLHSSLEEWLDKL